LSSGLASCIDIGFNGGANLPPGCPGAYEPGDDASDGATDSTTNKPPQVVASTADVAVDDVAATDATPDVVDDGLGDESDVAADTNAVADAGATDSGVTDAGDT
jgi:hypothetical protein